MSEGGDQSYYLTRAMTERALADSASDEAAAAIHLKLAEEYERRAADPSPQPLRVVGEDKSKVE